MFGAHDLTQLAVSGFFSASPQKVFLHPYWNPASRKYEADIAVLLMKDEVAYNDFVKPICLPSSKLASSSKGFVAGWGQSEKMPIEEIPRELEVPIYDENKCIEEAAGFKDICANNTLCAASRDGSGVCRGDSGK